MGRANADKKIPRGTQIYLKSKKQVGEDYYEKSNTESEFGVVDESHMEPVKVNFEKKVIKKNVSKRERKRLENIVAKKKKVAIRADLHSQLREVQFTNDLAINSFKPIVSLSYSRHKKRQITDVINNQVFKSQVLAGGSNYVPKNDSPELLESNLESDDTSINSKKAKLGRSVNPTQVAPHSQKAPANFLAFALALKENNRPMTTSMINSDEESSGTNSESEFDSIDSDDEKMEDKDSISVLPSSSIDLVTKEDILIKIPTAVIKAEAVPLVKESSTKPNYVIIERDAAIQSTREKLPIFLEEQSIMETIMANTTTIICGETGSGKTTQVPQFLIEYGFGSRSGKYPGKIAVTEPRRVAAISMSERVGKELNNPEMVGYKIRYDDHCSDKTAIKFLTDGVLLKEIERDFLLSEYSAVIIDEAHERSINTDILIGLLSRIVLLRLELSNDKESVSTDVNGGGGIAGVKPQKKVFYPLKLIIMSATLRVNDFADNKRLFASPPPIIKVDTRQFPVTVHFNKRTPHNDYIKEAFKKTCKIHDKLPNGGILVFVSSQREVATLVRKLNQKYNQHQDNNNILSNNELIEDTGENSLNVDNNGADGDESPLTSNYMENIEIDKFNDDLSDAYDYNTSSSDESGFSGFEDEEEIGADDVHSVEDNTSCENAKVGTASKLGGDKSWHPSKMIVLPLYAMLPKKQQMRVFDKVEVGTRLVIVATNVAETSITIPSIRYVVDTGKVKEKNYDSYASITKFEVVWTSKASASQRSGRAGRTGPGHSYRLFSSAVFENYFEEFVDPEILRLPIEGLLLLMKKMGIDHIANFPFPTPPDIVSIDTGLLLLKNLGAIDFTTERITPIGKKISNFPIAPRYAKMITTALQTAALPYVICIAAALAVGNIFSESVTLTTIDTKMNDTSDLPNQNKCEEPVKSSSIKKWAGSNTDSDLMAIVRAIGAFEYAGCSESFCEKNGLVYKSMIEIHKLRGQLIRITNMIDSTTSAITSKALAIPKPKDKILIWQSLLSAFGDHVAWKTANMHTTTAKDNVENQIRKLKNAYLCEATPGLVYIHPTSSLAHNTHPIILYIEIESSTKMFLKFITNIDKKWLAEFVPERCEFGKPLESPQPFYDSANDSIMCYKEASYGKHKWPLGINKGPFPRDNIDIIKYFAYNLLVGNIFSSLQNYQNDYLASPITITKLNAQKRCIILVSELARFNICTRKQLSEKWAIDKTYLLSEFTTWLRTEAHSQLKAAWPPA